MQEVFDKYLINQMNYKSPIEIIHTPMQMQMEGDVLKTVQRYGINVDKEELLKALAYDRGQYEKGYEDGLNVDRWIPCSERLPSKDEYIENGGRFIVTDGNRVYQSIYDIYIHKWFRTLQLNCLIDLGYKANFEVDKCVIAWQPLPEPYRGE